MEKIELAHVLITASSSRTADSTYTYCPHRGMSIINKCISKEFVPSGDGRVDLFLVCNRFPVNILQVFTVIFHLGRVWISISNLRSLRLLRYQNGWNKGCLVALGKWTINGIFMGCSSNQLSHEINSESNFIDHKNTMHEKVIKVVRNFSWAIINSPLRGFP